MSRRRALVVCPGRGSYDKNALGQLKGRSAAAQTIVDACDAHRVANGRPPVSELDAAERYTARLHVAGEHASLLTFACTLADLAELDEERHEVVGVIGNSMGWYTACAAAGALPLEEAIRLVDTMGAYQVGNVIGGQVLYPVCDEAWRPDPERIALVDRVCAELRAEGLGAWWSIRLGGHAVLGADAEGVRQLLQRLPQDVRGPRTFPLQLPLHSAFHTRLLAETSERARTDLADLAFTAPRVPLIDGRGAVFRPWTADPAALFDYTLGEQVVETYDFDASVRTAMHHLAPDVVVLLGPGNPLGGPVARLLVQDGTRGVTSRADFEVLQAEDPVLLSFGVPDQRARLV